MIFRKLIWEWCVFIGIVAPACAGSPRSAGPLIDGTTLFHDSFELPDGLITNEYSHWNPMGRQAAVSPGWEMTSGSLFVSNGAAWSGVPDNIRPDAGSTYGNNSAVFRLTTKRSDFADVEVRLSLFNVGLSSTTTTPATEWDGIHIFLRYQSQYHLYYASVNRRDNTVIVKKKIPGGPSNNGTYFNLGSHGPYKVPYNAWQKVRATVKNNSDGSVSIRLYADGKLLVSAKDNGAVGGAPITAPGKVGIRADNCQFQFDDFSISTFIDAANITAK